MERREKGKEPLFLRAKGIKKLIRKGLRKGGHRKLNYVIHGVALLLGVKKAKKMCSGKGGKKARDALT